MPLVYAFKIIGELSTPPMAKRPLGSAYSMGAKLVFKQIKHDSILVFIEEIAYKRATKKGAGGSLVLCNQSNPKLGLYGNN
jgi:hypothetical protein